MLRIAAILLIVLSFSGIMAVFSLILFPIGFWLLAFDFRHRRTQTTTSNWLYYSGTAATIISVLSFLFAGVTESDNNFNSIGWLAWGLIFGLVCAVVLTIGIFVSKREQAVDTPIAS